MHCSLVLAEVGRPLFGNQWLALLAILGGVAVFMALIAVAGRLLAKSHPDEAKRAAVPSAEPIDGLSSEMLAVIAAAVAVTAGPRARIAAVLPVKSPGPSIETLMQQWSVEGRRQIYSSHQIR